MANKELKVEFVNKQVELFLHLPGQDPLRINFDPDFDINDSDAYNVSDDIQAGSVVIRSGELAEYLSLSDTDFNEFVQNLRTMREHTYELVKRMSIQIQK